MIMRTAKRCKRTSPLCTVLFSIRWKISTIPRRALVSLRYAVLPSIRDSLKIRDDEGGGDRYVQQQGQMQVLLGYLVDRSCLSVGIPSRYVEGCIVGISLLLVPLFLSPFGADTSQRRLGSFSKELLEISLLDIKPPFNGPLIQIGFSNFFFFFFFLPLPTNVQNGPTTFTRDWGKPLILGILSARLPRGIQNGSNR